MSVEENFGEIVVEENALEEPVSKEVSQKNEEELSKDE